MADSEFRGKVYHLGYQGWKAEDLELRVRQLDAVLIDCRMSARSRQPEWAKSNLAKRFGVQYQHLEGFGNMNYKNPSMGAVALKQPYEASLQVEECLRRGVNVIIMCACWNFRECHRMVVCDYIQRRTGLRAEAIEKVTKAERQAEQQPSLFASEDGNGRGRRKGRKVRADRTKHDADAEPL